jgi:hypothetical protein
MFVTGVVPELTRYGVVATGVDETVAVAATSATADSFAAVTVRDMARTLRPSAGPVKWPEQPMVDHLSGVAGLSLSGSRPRRPRC